jgi:hypothetical protein
MNMSRLSVGSKNISMDMINNLKKMKMQRHVLYKKQDLDKLFKRK